MKNARRKQRSARRRLVQPGQPIRRTSRKVNRDAGVSVANTELHHLLTVRGWTEVCRAEGPTIYDWPPSAPDEDHEITYLTNDLRGKPGVWPLCRVSAVNGDRLMYEVESASVADLDKIEATRCAGCTPCLRDAAR